MTPRQELAAAFRSAIFDRVVWRLVSDPPKDGHITIVSGPGRSSVGVFRNGEWRGERGKALTFVPTHWMGFTDE